MLGKIISKVTKTERSAVREVISAVEQICSVRTSRLEKADRFAESLGPVLIDTVQRLCDL